VPSERIVDGGHAKAAEGLQSSLPVRQHGRLHRLIAIDEGGDRRLPVAQGVPQKIDAEGLVGLLGQRRGF